MATTDPRRTGVSNVAWDANGNLTGRPGSGPVPIIPALYAFAAPQLIYKSNQVFSRSSVNSAADNVQQPLTAFLLPAGIMGPNGTLRWEAETQYNNSAANKAFQLRIGAVGICPEYGLTTTTNDNRGLAWHNVTATSQKYRGSFVLQSTSTVGFVTTAIDTTVDQTVQFVCRWSTATASETITLQSLTVWIEYGA